MNDKLELNKKIVTTIQCLFIIIIPCIIIYMKMFLIFNTTKPISFFKNAIIIPLLLYYSSYIISITIHELGHLIMGLTNKFQFLEFDFLIFSIFKENKKIKFKIKRLSKEIGGYCLMAPSKNIKTSEVIKYFLGGPIMNFFLFIINIIIAFLTNNNIIFELSLYIIFINLGMAISNLIPSETSTGTEFDGMQIYRIKHEEDYLDILNKNIQLSKLIRENVPIENIPDNLIYKPKSINNNYNINMMYIYLTKLLKKEKYKESEEIIKEYLNNSTKEIPQTLKNNLKIYLTNIYLETGNYQEIKKIYTPDLLKYTEKLSKTNPLFKINVYLYYVINNNTKEVNRVGKEIEEYFSKEKSPQKEEYTKTYDFINDKLKED